MIPYEVVCRKPTQIQYIEKRETVYIGFTDTDIMVQPCDNADGGEACKECRRRAALRYLEENAQK